MNTSHLRKSLGAFLAGALMLFGSFAYAEVVQTSLNVVARTLEAGYGHAEAKFRAEVAHQMATMDETTQALSSDLRRDSHGFRQASADEYQGFAALPS